MIRAWLKDLAALTAVLLLIAFVVVAPSAFGLLPAGV